MTLLVVIFFMIAGPMVVEIVGYFWHRFLEHEGKAGEFIRYRHWLHHEQDYPTTNLRPSKKYHKAGSWSWYVMALLLVVAAYILVPRPWSIIMIISGLIYAKFVTSAFHASFHKKNYWLNRYGWYKKLVKLHDIHHYKPVNFGINFFFMDKLFKTYSEKQPSATKIIFPDLPKEKFRAKLMRSART